MPPTEEDILELQRRRLEDAVKANVEGQLFRYYRNLGSAIIAVLGFFGIAIGWPALKSSIESQIQKQINVQVSEPIEAAKTAAAEAQQIAYVSLQGLKAQQSEINESIGRIGPKFENIQVRYGAAAEQIDALEEKTKEQQQLTEFLRLTYQAEPVKRDEVVELSKRLNDVAQQTQVLADVLGTLQPSNAGAARIDEAKQALTGVSEAAPVVDKNPRAASTVYVQFAGGKRSDIESVSEKLQDDGWRVPGEERNAGAANKKEIRYYYGSDQEAAELLASDLQKALDETGFLSIGDIVTKKLNPENFKVQPAQGILEVWLEIPLSPA